ncbi:MAG: glycosyltransferase family 4 protein [Candidatus Aureabacteria bacterium]|nr:glycosyltransferase family 4 protein [Candidatus Auribacterota bacterium]
MITRSIHQLIAGAGTGDAISNYAFEIRSILKKAGFLSCIFAPEQHIAREYKNGEVLPLSRFPQDISQEDILLYHYSIGSSATDLYKKTKCKKMLCYHNITPPHYFKNLSEKQMYVLEQGREELKGLSVMTDLPTAVSHFNSMELVEMGFSKPQVIPLIVGKDYLRSKPNSSIFNRFDDGKTNILFVGRMVPNKRFEDLIKTFYFYRKTIRPASRLILAGSYTGNEVYYTYLRSLIFDLDLIDSVIVTGHIALQDLVAYYQISHAFLCLSEHEGFCLPLIEAMYFNVPVFALDKAAIPETLKESGILIKKNDPKAIAELMDQVLSNRGLVREICENQKKRLENFNEKALTERLAFLLKMYFKVIFKRKSFDK